MSLKESLITKKTENTEEKKISSDLLKENISILEEMGFNKAYITKVFSLLNPTSIDKAINLMSEKEGIFQHNFMQNPNSESHQCYLCGNPTTAHINFDEIKDEIINNDYLDDNDSDDEGEEICLVCYNNYNKENMIKYNKCNHTFCKNCWLSYIKNKIENYDIQKFKCIQFNCKEILNEEFINNLICNDLKLIEKYEKFKNKLKILNDPTKIFCPIPNCESYGIKPENNNNDNKYIKCLNNHTFCLNCMRKEHGNEKCEKIEFPFEKLTSKRILKKCPNCSSWLEKTEGCNEIECFECKSHFCWLCGSLFTENHFKIGKCKGLEYEEDNNEFSKLLKKTNENKNNNNGNINNNINNYFDYLDYYDEEYENENNWEAQRKNNWRPARGEVPFSYWDPDGFVDPFHPLDNFENPMPIKCLIGYIILYLIGNPVLFSCKYFLDSWFGMDSNGVKRNVLTFFYTTEIILFIMISIMFIFANLFIMIIISLPCLFYWPLIRKYKIVWYCCFFVRVMFRNLSDSIFLF